MILSKIAGLVVVATSSLLLSPVAVHAQQLPCDTSVSGVRITPLVGTNQRLFVSDNFHTASGTPAPGTVPLTDLAYVSTLSIEGRDRQILNVLKGSGDGCFAVPTQPDHPPPPLVVGDQPSLIASGMLNVDHHADIAIIDALVDQFNPSPKLRIFFGDGAGNFKPGSGVSVFPLQQGQTPVALALGRFRGPTMPVDIAIASVPSDAHPTAGGQITMLINNGQGEFTAAPSPILVGDVQPAAMLASDGFRGGTGSDKRYDLVVKEVVPFLPRRSRILYLRNAGNGTFPDIAEITGGDSAGNTDGLLTGVLQPNSTAGNKLDIITYDRDLTLHVFVNDGLGGFNKRDPKSFAGNLSFPFAGPGLGVVDFGDNTLRLLGAVVTEEGPGTLMITADGSGGFVDPPDFRRFQDLPTPTTSLSRTSAVSTTSGESAHSATKSLIISSSVVAQFLNPAQGQKAGLALSAHQVVSEVTPGPCPPPTSRSRGAAGGPLSPLGPSSGHVCTNTNPIDCIDNITICANPPVFGECICKCPHDPPSHNNPPPPPTVCSKTTNFPPILVVIANPFDAK